MATTGTDDDRPTEEERHLPPELPGISVEMEAVRLTLWLAATCGDDPVVMDVFWDLVLSGRSPREAAETAVAL